MKNFEAGGFGLGETVSRRLSNRERGGARMKMILAVAVVAAIVFSAFKIVPVYVNDYDLKDSMQQEARFMFNPNTGRPKSLDEVRSDIARKAQQLGLPLQSDDIQVAQDGSKVSISADYTISVDLIVYQLSLHFHPQADNTSI